jgi:hypothetical protein
MRDVDYTLDDESIVLGTAPADGAVATGFVLGDLFSVNAGEGRSIVPITISEDPPTGGQDGDAWFQY